MRGTPLDFLPAAAPAACASPILPSRAAARYEAHARVQTKTAAELLAFTGGAEPRTILEPGCGTGLYTRMLLSAFPGASLRAVDLSAERVAAARAALASPCASFEAADAEALEFPPGSFDLVTSNAVFQWFRRLPETVDRYAGMLAEGGRLTFSFFGPGTYGELDASLRATFGEEARVTASRFAGPEALVDALAASFPRWTIEEKRHEEIFPSVRDLLRSIKGTGTRGNPGGARIAWTPGALARMERTYRDRFGEIRATYRVFYCKGER